MANHAVLVPLKMASKNVEASVRPVWAVNNLDNGNVFELLTQVDTTGSMTEVWNMTVPTSGSLSNLWMAAEPELPFLTNSAGTNRYNGLGTIQDFYISASLVFVAVKPHLGDIIAVTAEAFTSGTAPTAGQYAAAVNGAYTLTAQSAGGAGMTWKYLGATYIPSADGTIGSGRITAYKLELINT